jgi:predicted transcriptional regulator
MGGGGLQTGFEPSMKVLSKVMKIMSEKSTISKTALAQQSNVNYSRLLKHIRWLEAKKMVEHTVENGKARIRLTEQGRRFALALS